MSVLVTGGAGYIGSHVVRSLCAAGHHVEVVDDLSRGDRRVVPEDVPLHVLSVLDQGELARVMRRSAVTGVVHLAALKSVAESEGDPALYYRQNVGGMVSLVEACRQAGVRWILLSSSAAVYGDAVGDRIPESYPTEPTSAYGESKLACEWLLRRSGRAYGLRWGALRYFNVVGAAEPALGDTGTENLFPKVIAAMTSGEPPVIFGDDYPTRDGTCVRDFIHVADLAAAHTATVAALDAGRSEAIYNVGTGSGATVREVVESFRRLARTDLEPVVVGRRPGDPAAVVADATKISYELGWKAERTAAEAVVDSWNASQAMKGGIA